MIMLIHCMSHMLHEEPPHTMHCGIGQPDSTKLRNHIFTDSAPFGRITHHKQCTAINGVLCTSDSSRCVISDCGVACVDMFRPSHLSHIYWLHPNRDITPTGWRISFAAHLDLTLYDEIWEVMCHPCIWDGLYSAIYVVLFIWRELYLSLLLVIPPWDWMGVRE